MFRGKGKLSRLHFQEFTGDISFPMPRSTQILGFFGVCFFALAAATLIYSHSRNLKPFGIPFPRGVLEATHTVSNPAFKLKEGYAKINVEYEDFIRWCEKMNLVSLVVEPQNPMPRETGIPRLDWWRLPAEFQNEYHGSYKRSKIEAVYAEGDAYFFIEGVW